MHVCVVWGACTVGEWGEYSGEMTPQAELSDSRALCHVCVSVNKMNRWRSEMEIMPEAARVCSEKPCVCESMLECKR